MRIGEGVAYRRALCVAEWRGDTAVRVCAEYSVWQSRVRWADGRGRGGWEIWGVLPIVGA